MEHHMQKHPMLSVKEAAEALRIDERSVRDRLTNGTLKGEKKMVGLREKWFIYSGAVQSALAKQDDMNFIGNSVAVQESNEPQTIDATSVPFTETDDSFDTTYGDLDEVAHTQAPATSTRGDWHPESKANLESLVETFMKPLVDKIATQERALMEQATVLADQEKAIEEQKRQLRLLPDLQKQAEERRKEAETKALEAIALTKQIDAMKSLAEEKAADLARLTQLETETLPTLERQLEQERLQKEKDLAETSAKLMALEKAKQDADEAKSKLEESLQSEIARLRDEKEEQAKAIESKFDALNEKLEQLQKPKNNWFKSLFLSSNQG
jgi:DNA repair exonuclease SbcCD ATPase subunit